MTSIAEKPAASEPLRATLVRTVPIAIVVGSVITLATFGVPSTPNWWWVWLARVVQVLWFSFGGHWVELAFLRVVMPALSQRRLSIGTTLVVRGIVWLIGGAVLGVGAMCSYRAILNVSGSGGWPSPHDILTGAWLGALAFVGIECVVHTVFTALGRPSAWRPKDGRIG